jgi:hypothetical protein
MKKRFSATLLIAGVLTAVGLVDAAVIVTKPLLPWFAWMLP